MLSSRRAWFGIAAALLALLLVGVALLLIVTMIGVNVAVSGSTVTVTNSGFAIHNARITIFEDAKSTTLSAVSIPSGTTTLTLPGPVPPDMYKGAAIEGTRLGLFSGQWFVVSQHGMSPSPPPPGTQKPRLQVAAPSDDR